MLQLHGSSAFNFFFAWKLRRSNKSCIQHFMNVEVVVVIFIVVYTTCKKNSPNDHLDSGYYRLYRSCAQAFFFEMERESRSQVKIQR